MKKVFITIGVIVVLLTIVICGVMGYKYFSHHSYATPEKTVRSFVNALNDQNANDMLDCIDPGEAEYIRMAASFLEDDLGVESISEMRTWLPFMSAFADVTVWPRFDIEILEVTNEDSSAKLNTRFINKNDGSTFEYEFKLISSDSRWYIQLVSF